MLTCVLVGRCEALVGLSLLLVELLARVLRRAFLSRFRLTRGRQLVRVVPLLLGGGQTHALVAPAAAAFDEVVQLLEFQQQGVQGLGVGDDGIGGGLVYDVVVERVPHMLVLDVE